MRTRGSRSLGFTLMELLVVVSIMALLGGLSIAAFQTTYRRYSLTASASEIAVALRTARNTSIMNGTPSVVVVDPTTRAVSGSSYHTVAEWSFDGPDGDSGAVGGKVNGARVAEGKVGRALDFRGKGAHVDCGSRADFDAPDGLRIEAWVRREGDPAPPARRGKTSGTRRRRSRTTRRGGEERVHVIVRKDGAYALRMTESGALEAQVGSYVVRTARPVVAARRWVAVRLEFEAGRLTLFADGVPRELSPPAGGTRAGTGNGAPRPPGRVPQSAAPLTISAPDAPFPGRIDEVKLIRRLEHLRFTHAEGQKIVGWRKEIRFDRRGHLDPAHHEGGVRIVLVELDDDDPGAGDESSSRTAPSVDYSLRFDQWLERSRPPTARWARTAAASATSASPSGSEPTQEEEEAKIEARYRTHRTAVVVVDLLGVVR